MNALVATQPMTPEEGGIKFVLNIPASGLLFRIALADGEYQFQVWEADESKLHFATSPTKTYATAVADLLYQIAVDELDGTDFEDTPQAKMLLGTLELITNNR